MFGISRTNPYLFGFSRLIIFIFMLYYLYG
nr:MAG TPA_asm: hypothetical protein [Caudoviricetes sp.]